MDSVVVGVYHYGGGTATVDPPMIDRRRLPAATLKPEVAAYLDEFFGVVQPAALDRDLLDWTQLRSDATALAGDATSPADVHDVLNLTLRRIDHHSYLQPPADHADWSTGVDGTDEVDPDLAYATGRIVEERMAYLTVPGISSGHDKTLRAYADSLQQLIARLDQPGVDEWIIDLRQNTGGNCWAMLAGIGPLLGQGVCGYFMDRDTAGANAWWYWKGGSYLDRDLRLQLTDPYQLQRGVRVAVLYGPETASSGEVVAIAFRNMAGTRSFGQPTSGYSTGNRTYYLSDGAAVLLTVSVYGDRDKNAYGGPVPPDETVAPARGTDAAAEAAATWLRSQRQR